MIDATFPVEAGAEGLRVALEIVAAEAEAAIDAGYQFVVLSDRAAGPDRVAISSLLALGRVHQHLVQVGGAVPCWAACWAACRAACRAPAGRPAGRCCRLFAGRLAADVSVPGSCPAT